MPNSQAAFFDLYDTLVFVDRGKYEQKISECAKTAGVGETTFASAWRDLYIASTTGELRATEDRAKAVLSRLGVRTSDDRIFRITEIEYNFLRTGMNIYPDAGATLAQLRSIGIALGLITNASQSAHILIEHLGLNTYFDAIVISSDIGIRKPAPQIYEHAMAELKVKPPNCFFVGDGTDDELGGAARLGISTIWVRRNERKYNQPESDEELPADFVVGSLEEASNVIIQRLNSPQISASN